MIASEKIKNYCCFCGKIVLESDKFSITEDAEICHTKCLDDFEKTILGKQEDLDLLGY